MWCGLMSFAFLQANWQTAVYAYVSVYMVYMCTARKNDNQITILEDESLSLTKQNQNSIHFELHPHWLLERHWFEQHHNEHDEAELSYRTTLKESDWWWWWWCVYMCMDIYLNFTIKTNIHTHTHTMRRSDLTFKPIHLKFTIIQHPNGISEM